MNLIGYKMAVLQSPCTRERINQLWTLAVLTPSSSSCNATATWKLPGRPAGGRPAAGPCSLGQGGRGPGRHRAHRLHGQRSAVRPDGRSQDPGVGRSIRAAGVLSRACPHLQLQCLACTGCGALCVRRWHLCECDCEWLGSQSWKQIFLQRNRRERRMAHARPEDFICKQVTENVGILGPIAYLTGNDLTTDRPSRPIVCTVSSFDKLYAWDVQKGSIFWSSPVQDSSITNLVTLPELCMAVTMDRERTIKVWDCLHEDALSEFFMPYDCFSLTAFLSARGPVLMVSGPASGWGSRMRCLLPSQGARSSCRHIAVCLSAVIPSTFSESVTTYGWLLVVWTSVPSGTFSQPSSLKKLPDVFHSPVLQVGDSTGDMYTFKIPSLTEISRTKAFQFSVDILRCSPCRKWVFVCGTQQCSFPKVFLTECLLKPLDTPQSFSLPFLSCLGASWTPRRESRITLMFRRDPKKMGFITFDLTTRRTEDRTVIGADRQFPAAGSHREPQLDGSQRGRHDCLQQWAVPVPLHHWRPPAATTGGPPDSHQEPMGGSCPRPQHSHGWFSARVRVGRGRPLPVPQELLPHEA
ncbi:F-box/WD repeat-containing protein 12 isoform X2 [Lepus europaeus]|uniref:F-box/WD repeat-containing protein 12 isoform X2 n=1 Tax=Lepus europaeus TaxID=9983 RepID=UPI002B4976F2|nr:F-box/WD repeat-containing protein 12 isoform X2 [Lepus europaeus]